MTAIPCKISGQHFRFYGIDPSESDQTCTRNGNKYAYSKETTEALTHLVDGQTVVCEQQKMDDYNRIVAICRAVEVELNKWIVANGYTVTYQQYSKRYFFGEMKAKMTRKNLCSGSFQMPCDYRHGSKLF